jgi:hypothetical protein
MEERRVKQADVPGQEQSDEPHTQPWVYAAAVVILLGLVLLFVAMHLGGTVPTH